jgi:hypothetical protein
MSLRRLILHNLRALTDLTPLAEALALEEFYHAEAHLAPEDHLPVLRNLTVRSVGGYFKAQKKVRGSRFADLLVEYEKEKWSPRDFEYQ